MPHYRVHGKIANPLSDSAFKEGLETGHFVKKKHKAFCVLLYYSAIRKSEALRALREQFTLERDKIVFEVGIRLKKQRSWFKQTPPLHFPLEAPFMKDLYEAVEETRPKKRVFPYSSKTGYNIVARVFKYPHLFRLTRITQFFLDNWSIAQVRSWTGLSLQALEYYVGLVDIIKMGESLAQKTLK